MILTEANTKMWSRIGSRATYGMTILELGSRADDLMVLTGDTSTSAGLDRFKKTYPEKYLDVGIAEQNMVGIAAGLASEGFKVFSSTFAPFQTMRCCEQIKVNLGYMQQNVCLVGLASGVVLGTLGYTHCCIEDISIMRSIPGMTVLSPADCGETVKATLAAIDHDHPVYIRLTGGAKNPVVYKEEYKFEIGKAIALREGNDVSIIATGTMVHNSLAAAQLLAAEGISAAVINMHTIKPLDTKVIENVCNSSNLLVTVEEHSVIGGLGSAVSEYKTTMNQAPPQILIGLPDKYGKGGEYTDILSECGLLPNQIASTIAEKYRSLKSTI